MGPDDFERLTFTARDHAVARLDDCGLLVRDLLDGVAEILLVVEVDVGDHRDPEVQGIGRIEPSPKAHLAYQAVDPRREICERHPGTHIDLCRLYRPPPDFRARR